MAEPLNYHNARGPEQLRSPAPRAAVPVEFDTLLTRTSDLAAASAIENLLIAQKIALHRSDDGRSVHRVVDLYVHAADQAQAGELAAAIFVRRKKLRSFAPVYIPVMATSKHLSNRTGFPSEW